MADQRQHQLFRGHLRAFHHACRTMHGVSAAVFAVETPAKTVQNERRVVCPVSETCRVRGWPLSVWQGKEEAGVVQVGDMGSGDLVLLAGTSRGNVSRLRLTAPLAPGSDPSEVQVDLHTPYATCCDAAW